MTGYMKAHGAGPRCWSATEGSYWCPGNNTGLGGLIEKSDPPELHCRKLTSALMHLLVQLIEKLQQRQAPHCLLSRAPSLRVADTSRDASA